MYKLVHACRLPLRGRRGHVPALQGCCKSGRTSVGWGHVPTGAGTSDCVQTCSFVPSAASRTARPVVVPYECGTHSRRRARRLGAPVQELPNAHKLVRLYRLPLRGRRGHVPALQGLLQIGTHLCRVGTCPHRCRNYQVRTAPFPCTVCRFAVGTPSGRALRMWDAPSP